MLKAELQNRKNNQEILLHSLSNDRDLDIECKSRIDELNFLLNLESELYSEPKNLE